MFTTPFWPPAPSYPLSMMELPVPDHLPTQALQHIHHCLRLTEAINQLETITRENEGVFPRALREKMCTLCFRLAQLFDDPDTRQGLLLRAELLADDVNRETMLPMIAGLDEQQLVVGIGNISTWVGKSKQTFYSAWFGVPDLLLQEISDMMDSFLPANLALLQQEIAADLRTLPGSAYKLVNLFAIAGEANSYPKHFAYFIPEDEGLKYSPVKRTVVFANTYLHLFEQFARPESERFGWGMMEVPEGQVCQRYLTAWFRGHDLGHSLVRQENVFPRLSKLDRWGSMMVQEALADVFGLLMCTSPQVTATLRLDNDVMARIYMLEMLRYLRRGPNLYPDAGAAYIQFNYLLAQGCLEIVGNRFVLHLQQFYPAMTELARLMSDELLGGDNDLAREFMATYCPHYDEAGVAALMAKLGTCANMVEYNQLIKGLPL